MSRLIYSDNGFVIPDQCEEVNQLRREAKELTLSATSDPLRLHFLARPHRLDSPPLKVAVNDIHIASIDPQGEIPAFRWYVLDVPPEKLRGGSNRFEFWSEGAAMNAWTLAVEVGWREASGGSTLSLDGGNSYTWQGKGRLGINLGEYLVRARIQEREDHLPPKLRPEIPDHPRLSLLRGILPEQVTGAGPLLEQVHRLLSYTSTQFEYRSSATGALNTPWDADTIFFWGRAKN